MSSVDFNRVLSMLQGWLGHRISVHIENPYSDGIPLSVVGDLSADNGMAEPFDENEFDFAVGEAGGFTINRLKFIGASATQDEVHIETGSGEHPLVIVVALMDS